MRALCFDSVGGATRTVYGLSPCVSQADARMDLALLNIWQVFKNA